MKKLLVLSILLLGTIPVYATAVEEGATPDATVQNTKGFCGINYNRQDLEEPGRQVIVNDHSAFNININIFKKGALLKGKTTSVEPAIEEK